MHTPTVQVRWDSTGGNAHAGEAVAWQRSRAVPIESEYDLYVAARTGGQSAIDTDTALYIVVDFRRWSSSSLVVGNSGLSQEGQCLK